MLARFATNLAVPSLTALRRRSFALLALVSTALSTLTCGLAFAQSTVTNGILTLDFDPASSEFSIQTGANHPNPAQTVFYPVGTSYITVRDFTHGTIYVNDAQSSIDPGSGQLSTSMGAGSVAPIGTRGFRTTWALPFLTVVQEVEITGSSLVDTNVRHQVSVQNTGTSPLAYGIRYLWDWQIAGNDASLSRPRFPDGTFTNVFTAYPAPDFQTYEQTDSLTNPTFTIYGSVQGGSLPLPPTRPDRVAYVSWVDFVTVPWDYPVSGKEQDSAIVYYWGYNTPLTLAPGASSSVRQYVSTVASGVGVTTLTKTMTEYLYAPFAYYFLTSRDNEKQALDNAAGWSRTGNAFTVLANNDPGSKGITRYYFDKVARGGARGSHFYTLVAAEKTALNGLNPGNLALPGKPYSEDIDSFAYLPVVEGVGGSCAAGQTPLYRAFRGQARFPDDANHRFTTDITLYNSLVAQGWDAEGVKACLPR